MRNWLRLRMLDLLWLPGVILLAVLLLLERDEPATERDMD